MKVAKLLGTAIAGSLLVGAALVDPGSAAPPHRAPVTVQLVLSHNRGPAGPPIEGTLRFTNVTKHTVSVNQCRGWFQVGLQSRTIPFNPSWGPFPVRCTLSAYHLAPGHTRLHVVVSTRYYACDAFYRPHPIPPGHRSVHENWQLASPSAWTILSPGHHARPHRQGDSSLGGGPSRRS